MLGRNCLERWLEGGLFSLCETSATDAIACSLIRVNLMAVSGYCGVYIFLCRTYWSGLMPGKVVPASCLKSNGALWRTKC